MRIEGPAGQQRRCTEMSAQVDPCSSKHSLLTRGRTRAKGVQPEPIVRPDSIDETLQPRERRWAGRQSRAEGRPGGALLSRSTNMFSAQRPLVEGAPLTPLNIGERFIYTAFLDKKNTGNELTGHPPEITERRRGRER